MGRTFLIILAALLGAALAVALVLMFSSTPARQQLVGDRPLAYWLSCLDSDKDELRASAEANLPAFGVIAVAPLVQRLDARDPAVARSAKAALTTIGAGAVPALARSLRSGSAARRQAVIELLTALGGKSMPASHDIAALLDDPNVGRAAADYFVLLGPTSPAIDKAARVLGGIDQPRRLDAIRILSQVRTDPRTVEALIANARTSDPVVRREVYLSICELPAPPPAAIQVLIDRFTDAGSRPTSHNALVRIGTPAVTVLAAYADNPDEQVRLGAVKALTTILSQTGGALAPLEGFANDPSRMVAEHARTHLSFLRSRAPMIQSAAQLPSPKPVPLTEADSEYVAIGKKFDPTGADDLASSQGEALTPPSKPPASVEQTPVHVPPQYDSKAFDDAVARLDDPNPIARKRAEEQVRTFYAKAGAVPLDFNTAPDAAERLRRVRLLPFSDDWRKYDLMILALREEELVVRRAAVSAMSRSLKSPRIVEKLIQTLSRDPSGTIRADAAEVLAAVKDQVPVSRALRAAQDDPDPAVANAAREALR